jgi:8-oxo-dGTP pyrophosphatase MutT (NUDIX family)
MKPNEQIAALLDAHIPADAKEEADMQLIAKMLLTTANLMDQSHQAGHITASALVLDAHTGRFLLHYHKKLNRWLQFGGHIEPHETDPAQAALREAIEESGLTDLRFLAAQPLDIDIHPIPARGDQPTHLHLDFRYGLVTETPEAVIAAGDESAQFQWFAEHEVGNEQLALDPALRRLIKKALALFQATK